MPKLATDVSVRRVLRGTVLGLGLALIAPATVEAQLGAIGAIGTIGGSGIFERTPVFTESALVLPRGSWAVSTYGQFVQFADLDFSQVGFIGDTLVGRTVDITSAEQSQVALSAAVGVSDRFLVGVLAPRYVPSSTGDFDSVQVFVPRLPSPPCRPQDIVPVDTDATACRRQGEIDEDGWGDPFLFGRYQVLGSEDTDYKLAASASASLPLGDERFGRDGISVGISAVGSQRWQQFSVHGNLALVFLPENTVDAEIFGTERTLQDERHIVYNAAAVLGVSENLQLSAELLGRRTDLEEEFRTIVRLDRETGEFVTKEFSASAVDLAPGLRFSFANYMFLDAAVRLRLNDDAFDGLDNVWVLGLSYSR
jgi:hypothetical protein